MSAASDELGGRVRALIGHLPGMVERRMFGGFGFMLDGNMVVGITSKGILMVRVGPAEHRAALARPGAFELEMGPRTMSGFIGVDEEGTADADGLRGWIDAALAFVRTLPPKEPKRPKTPAKR